MANTTGIEIDMKQFNRAAEELWKRSSRTVADFINGQLAFLASRAIQVTRQADRARVEHVLGSRGRELRVDKRKSAKAGQLVYLKRKQGNILLGTEDEMKNSLAARIVNARLVKAGQEPIWGRKLEAAARKLIGSRLRSVGFIRSRWVAPLRAMKRVVKSITPAGPTPRIYGVPKGYAVPAVGWRRDQMTGLIANRAQDGRSTHTAPQALEVARSGLAEALRIQTKDMQDELARRMAGVVKPLISPKHVKVIPKN